MIFLDSSFLLALIFENDKNNDAANTLKPLINKQTKLINNTVILEVLNSLKQTNHKIPLENIIMTLFSFDNIHYLTKNDYNDAINIFKYYNESINFSDCTILKTMNKYNIDKIVSFDSDFDKIKGIKRIYL